MPDRLCVFLNHHLTASIADAVIVDDKQQIKNIYHQLSLTEIASLQDHRRVIVIIPSLIVKIATVTLPHKIQNFKKALPYLLEEEFAEDVDDLFFAVMPLKNNEYLAVAIQKKLREDILDNLSQHGITPDYLIPDIFAFTFSSDEPSIIVGTQYFMFYDKAHAFAFEQDMLPLVVKDKLNARVVSFKDSDPSLLMPLQKNSHLAHEPQKKLYIEAIAQQCEPKKSISLIASNFGSTKRNKDIFTLWYSVAILVALWLGISLISSIISYFTLQHRLVKQQESNLAIYRHFFPNASTMILPEIRVKRLLETATGNSTGSTVFVLLEKISDVVGQHPNTKVNSFEFKNNQLTLDLTVDQFQVLAKIQSELQRNQLKVKQLNASNNNNQVKARLEISL